MEMFGFCDIIEEDIMSEDIFFDNLNEDCGYFMCLLFFLSLDEFEGFLCFSFMVCELFFSDVDVLVKSEVDSFLILEYMILK